MKIKIKLLIASTSLLALALISLIGIKLKEDNIIPESYHLEYGETFNLSSLDEYTHHEKHDITDIGEYIIPVSYRKYGLKFNKNISIQIKDTTPPLISQVIDNITVTEGEIQEDLSSFFKVEDLSETSLYFDLKQVDWNTPGDYEAIAHASDIYNNKAKLDFTITVQNSLENNDSSLSVSEPTFVHNLIFVNKKHPLPLHYISSEDPTALHQLKLFITEMQDQGLDIDGSYSGYRSIAHQKKLYQNYVKQDGKAAADRYSARPGYSEHHTGFAFDLKHRNKHLVTGVSESQYIKDNAHRYGFIVRYPEHKEHITGYMPEPWHLRYVGDLAQDIYSSRLTLEEYFNIPGGGY